MYTSQLRHIHDPVILSQDRMYMFTLLSVIFWLLAFTVSDITFCSNFAFRFSRYRLLYSAFFCFLILSIIFRLLLLSYIVSIVVVCHNRITRRKCVTVVWAQLISLPSRRMYHIPLPYPSSAFHAHTHMYRQRMLRWRHGFFLKMVFSRSTLSLDIYMSTGLCIRLVHISTSLGLSLCPCKDLFFVTAPLRALLFPCSQWLRQD